MIYSIVKVIYPKYSEHWPYTVAHTIAGTASRVEALQRQDATKKTLIEPILSLYYEECLASSNLNSKLLRFHSVRPNLHTSVSYVMEFLTLWVLESKVFTQKSTVVKFKLLYFVNWHSKGTTKIGPNFRK